MKMQSGINSNVLEVRERLLVPIGSLNKSIHLIFTSDWHNMCSFIITSIMFDLIYINMFGKHNLG